MDIPWLREPVEDPLEKLRLELHNQWLAFNRELKRGTLKHLDYDKKTNTLNWHRTKSNTDTATQTQIYKQLPHCDVTDVLRFVNDQCQFLSELSPLQPRYIKQEANTDNLIATITAQAMNYGNLVMSQNK